MSSYGSSTGGTGASGATYSAMDGASSSAGKRRARSPERRYRGLGQAARERGGLESRSSFLTVLKDGIGLGGRSLSCYADALAFDSWLSFLLGLPTFFQLVFLVSSLLGSTETYMPTGEWQNEDSGRNGTVTFYDPVEKKNSRGISIDDAQKLVIEHDDGFCQFPKPVEVSFTSYGVGLAQAAVALLFFVFVVRFLVRKYYRRPFITFLLQRKRVLRKVDSDVSWFARYGLFVLAGLWLLVSFIGSRIEAPKFTLTGCGAKVPYDHPGSKTLVPASSIYGSTVIFVAIAFSMVKVILNDYGFVQGDEMLSTPHPCFYKEITSYEQVSVESARADFSDYVDSLDSGRATDPMIEAAPAAHS